MSTALHLARPENLEKLLPMVAAFHAEDGIEQDDATRRAALLPLLEGCPFGAVYVIGPNRAPVGYIIVTFGWSVAFGGMDASIDEFYIRPAVRGRGMGSDVVMTLPRALAEAGVRAIHLKVDHEKAMGTRLYQRAGFVPRDRYMLMTRKLI